MRTGRPSKYKKQYCDMLISHMKQGYSFESFAGIIGVNRDTVHEWVKRHKDFSDAKNIGRAYEEVYWVKLYNQAAIGIRQMKDSSGKVIDVNPNAALIIFKMKNAFGWKDKNEISGNLKLVTQEDIVDCLENVNPE